MSSLVDVKSYLMAQEPALNAFAKKSLGVQTVHLNPLAQDWASRRYFRVGGAGQSYVVMQAVPDHVPTATMGHKLSSFIKVATLLSERGIRTPRIIDADIQNGFVLLEDFGDVTLGKALESGVPELDIYTKATDVLIKIRQTITLNDLCDFSKYKDSYIRKGRQRIVDWYLPATRLQINADDAVSAYESAWDSVAAQLPPPPIGLIHGDFHLQNLMLLADGDVGVLDFQDAMAGPAPYDLGNLLENIRTDVPHEIYDAMMKRYGMDDVSKAWFRVMATQFHCRILGQVFRLAILSGKHDLMRYIPRIQEYIKSALQDPVLKPLADWFKEEGVNLDKTDFDIERIKPFVRPDAF